MTMSGLNRDDMMQNNQQDEVSRAVMLRSELESLTAGLQHGHEQRIESLKMALANAEEEARAFQSKNEQHLMLQSELENMAESWKSDQQQEIQRLKRELSDAHQDVEACRAKNKQLEKRLQQDTKEREEIEEQVAALRRERGRLRVENANAQDEIEAFRSKNEKLEKRLLDAAQERAELEEKLVALKKDQSISFSDSGLVNAQKEIEKLLSANEELEKRLKQEAQGRMKLEHHVATLWKEHESLYKNQMDTLHPLPLLLRDDPESHFEEGIQAADSVALSDIGDDLLIQSRYEEIDLISDSQKRDEVVEGEEQLRPSKKRRADEAKESEAGFAASTEKDDDSLERKLADHRYWLEQAAAKKAEKTLMKIKKKETRDNKKKSKKAEGQKDTQAATVREEIHGKEIHGKFMIVSHKGSSDGNESSTSAIACAWTQK